MERKYYEAYDERYRQIHKANLQWFDDAPSDIVIDTIQKYKLNENHSMLEIGCGEGRDAIPLLRSGFNLLATDVSAAAIDYCRKKAPVHAECFQILDCVSSNWDEQYDFIYAVAVIHMLVRSEDRDAFYSFISKHLKRDGLALICSMGDGNIERETDIRTAFDLHLRIHEKSGNEVHVANTSCKMVGFAAFRNEIKRNCLKIIEEGITSAETDFPVMMYAVVKRSF